MESPGRFDHRHPSRRLARFLGAPALLLLAWAQFGSSALGQAVAAWPGLQGGPAHLGASGDRALRPPLRQIRTTSFGGDGRLSAVAVAAGVALTVARTSLIAFNPSTGKMLWAVPRAEGPLAPPAVDLSAGAAGTVVFIEGRGSRGALVGVDLASHAKLWRTVVGQGGGGGPTALEGTAFVGTRARYLYAIDDRTGRVRWRARLDHPIETAPAVANGRVFALSEDRRTGRASLFALPVAGCGSLQCGPRWIYRPSRVGLGVLSPTVAGGAVYVGFSDLTVRALDTATGKVQWDAPVRGDFSSLSTPAFAGGDLIVADRTGGVYRFDGTTGHQVWDYQFPTLVIWGAPLVVGTSVYVGLDDGRLVAIDLRSGHLVWETTMRHGPIGALTPAADLLLAPSVNLRGGIVALRHDPSGRLVDVPSPTRLKPVVAVVNFAGAFGVMLVVLLALFRLLARPRTARQGERRRTRPGRTR